MTNAHGLTLEPKIWAMKTTLWNSETHEVRRLQLPAERVVKSDIKSDYCNTQTLKTFYRTRIHMLEMVQMYYSFTIPDAWQHVCFSTCRKTTFLYFLSSESPLNFNWRWLRCFTVKANRTVFANCHLCFLLWVTLIALWAITLVMP